jgi:signal transduction histidine kinase
MGERTWQCRLLLSFFGVCVFVLIGQSLVESGRWLNEPFPGFFVYENLTVGPYYAPGWTGAASGLRSLDRISGIDGQEIKDRLQLYDTVHKAAPGNVFRYRVIRNSRSLEMDVASMNFAFRDWLLTFGIYIVIGLAFLLIGVAPYLYRASSAVALPLCFMVLLVFVWFQTTFDFLTSAALPKEIRIFALALTPSAAIHLALLLQNANVERNLRALQLVVIYGSGAVVGALNSFTYFAPLWLWIPIYRSSYIFVCIGALAFLVIIASALRNSCSDLERSRLRVILVGALLGFLVPALATLAATFLDLSVPYNMALIPTVCFPISVAYALLKYSLFDLGNALKVAVSRFALIALLVAIYAALAFLAVPWAGQYARDPLVPISFSILVVLIFNPLLRWLEGVVDRYIYRQEYDPAAVQADVSLFLRTLDDGQSLADGFVERVSEKLGIDNVVVLYRSGHASRFLTATSASMGDAACNLAKEFSVIAGLFEQRSACAVSRDEAAMNPRFRENKETMSAVFALCKTELFMPLVYERQTRGVVSFGAKRSGHEISAEDLRLLITLTEQLALSLENGLLYEESIAARRRAETSNQRLLEMDRMKKDFVANICHELRTPVSTIIGFGEVLRDPTFAGNPRDILDRLVNNGQELSKLMDSLMDFSRMEANGDATRLETVKLKEILAALEIMTQRLIRERPIEFGIHLESPVDTIESDGKKLQQILFQLLTNALKFTEKGRIELSVRRRREADQEMLEIAVADTGIGIKREDQDVIFEDFRQLEGSSTRHYGGTGLGLGLCKKLAATLGGEMRVSSAYGVGSVFSLLLPMEMAERDGQYAGDGSAPALL